ncbi:hypothetical protein CN212_03265 [Sinorhizobium meliloti]|nr:hypothetical protein CN212_03265 [Sinorhizobium meliloti]
MAEDHIDPLEHDFLGFISSLGDLSSLIGRCLFCGSRHVPLQRLNPKYSSLEHTRESFARVRRRIETPPPNHRPYNDQRGWQKLTYLAAYLFAARGSLKPEEMDAVLSTTEPAE